MAAEAQIWVLNGIGGPFEGKDVPIESGTGRVLGRSTEVDVVIEDDSLSRKHARVYERGGIVWICDLGSRNGTRINGRSIMRHRVGEGDRVAVGANLFRLEKADADRILERAVGEDSVGRSMSGSIQEIPLADVLQWLATSRKTGTLKVKGEKKSGALYLRDGAVYFARIGDSNPTHPEKVLVRMLGWEEGTFELDSAVLEDLPEERGIEVSLNGVLMEAARIQDELKHLGERYQLPEGSISLVLPSPKRWSELEGISLDLLQAVAEGSTWERILDELDADEIALTRGMIDLEKAGLVRYD